MTASLIRLLIVCSLFVSELVLALPIGFGINQGDLVYHELENPNFIVYFDERSPGEAHFALESLEQARPIVSRWIGKNRNSRLPVIMSAVSSNASFANVVTDAIELQTLGEAERGLYWHEYTHAQMYRHFHNFLGPAGALIHLPWIPAWFIEGLAETFSMSVGSDVIFAMERQQALSGSWPSFDRLHSLYGKGSFAYRGYATSGAFVHWILSQKPEKKLSTLLANSYRYTWPDYYIWGFNPLSSFLPWDETLRDWFGRGAKEAYKVYQKAARLRWQTHSKLSFFDKSTSKARLRLSYPAQMIKHRQTPYIAFAEDGSTKLRPVVFDRTRPWAIGGGQKSISLPENARTWPIGTNKTHLFATKTSHDIRSGIHQSQSLYEMSLDEHSERLLYQTPGRIHRITAWDQIVAWTERDFDKNSFCFLDSGKNDLAPTCPLVTQQPNHLGMLGEAQLSNEKTPHVWLQETERSKTHDRYYLSTWTLGQKQANWRREIAFPAISMASSQGELWLLTRGRWGRYLNRFDSQGRCQGEIQLGDLVEGLSSTAGESELLLTIWDRGGYSLRRLDPRSLPQRPCRLRGAPISPLQVALGSSKEMSLAEALKITSPHPGKGKSPKPPKSPKPAPSSHAPTDKETRETYDTTVQGASSSQKKPTKKIQAKRAKWRPRPVLALPWVGGDDAKGWQYGVVSVPLMDHMQNETLRATFLFGPASNYPHTEVSLLSTRFWPTLKLAAFRYQVWNGALYDPQDRRIKTSYLDVWGGRLSANYSLTGRRYWSSLELGIEVSQRQSFFGPPNVITGPKNLIFSRLNFSLRQRKWILSAGLQGKVAWKLINSHFDYNQLGGHLTASYASFWSSTLSLGLSASRTRGVHSKTPNMREAYVPLKTFIPGGGGGLNKNSYPLYGAGSLFSVRQGDSQARLRANYTVPIIKDINKLIWILYFERLDFSAFYNRGAAWYQWQSPRSRLLEAHGYNLDLSFENKGVRLNAGLGVGQVIGDPLQVYFKAGFDALF